MANNNWHPHMMKVFHEMRKLNPETKLMDAMKEAKKTYKKAQNGGKQRKSKSKSKSTKSKSKSKSKSRKTRSKSKSKSRK